MREAAKATLRAAATLVVTPILLSYAVRRAFIGDRAFEASMQSLALVPGLVGDYLRRAFLTHTIARMDPSATVRFGTLMSDPRARLEANVYVGPGCHLGFVHIERDALVAAGVHIPSGAATHGTAEADLPFREQPLTRTCVRIGQGAWIGSAAIVMADVGEHAVVGAGAVVTRPAPDYSMVAGVPARVIKMRTASRPEPHASSRP
jgi:acetyltransferase-like isoleucine patch superfamily enzyme